MLEIKEHDMDSLYVRILSDIQSDGFIVDSDTDKFSIGSNFGQKNRGTREIIGYKFVLSNPRSRLLYNTARQFNPFFALGQFIWNLKGSDELNMISFYNGKGINFSDDGKTIQGSCYGKRLFKTPSGLSQINSILSRLKEDPTSRRTFAPIFQPFDNISMTKDVPCPIGVQYFLRSDKLYAITYMRSNSAALVLPYNVFFFTMLQELLAKELNAELGDYIHICSSLHYYSDEESLVDDILADEMPKGKPMNPMPNCTSIEYLNNLVMFEQELRHSVNSRIKVDYWVDRSKEFDPYWAQIAYLLICHALQQSGQVDEVSEVAELLNTEYKYFLKRLVIKH